MIISQNVEAKRILNNLTKKQKIISSKSEKIFSGLRIKEAADDAAGLAISERMRAQIRGFSQAARNIQDGISLLDVADGALASIQDPPLQRMRELAIQAANDTSTDIDRKMIQEEVNQIKAEIARVFRNDHFNTKNIFVQDIKKAKNAIPGMLSGDTLIKEYGLQVVAGKNDVLTFRLDDQQKQIILNAGYYNADQLVQALNTQFADAGTDVSVAFVGESLVYHSPTKRFDSFGGSMIEINSPSAYTSVIYDNSKHGYIYGAAYVGKQDLSSDVTINSSNKTLTFRVGNNGVFTDVNITLAEQTYTKQDLLDTLNSYFDSNNISVTATTDAYNALTIRHDICGADYTLSNLGGTAKAAILDRVVSTTVNEYVISGSNGSTAAFSGYNAITSVVIESGKNDTLRFSVDGTNYSITLNAGTYNQAALATHLNNIFTANSINVTAQYNGSNNLQFKHNSPGSHTVGTVSGAAAYTLFGLSGYTPTVTPGTFVMIEGNSTPQAGSHAKVTGQTNLANGAQIVTGYNDVLTFNKDGVSDSITLSAGWYSKASLLTEINSKLAGKNVTASYDSYERLVFTHDLAGGGHPLFPYSLHNFGGSALNTLMGTLISTGLSYGSAPYASYIYGQNSISNITIASGVNDGLTIRVNGADHNITLSSGTYTLAQLITHLNDLMNTEGIGADIQAVPSGTRLRVESKTPGTAIQLNSVTGSAVNDLFRNVTTTIYTTTYSAPNSTDTYIDGRMSLQDEIVISSGINDVLEFDLHNYDLGTIDRKSVTLAEGVYSAESFITMLNDKLSTGNHLVKAAIKDVNTPQGLRPMLNLTYSPGINGSFAIDGVGGSAAYTVFYPGPYDIKYSGGEVLNFQVGSNSGVSFNAGVQILMNNEIIGLDGVNMATRAGASQAISAVDNAMSMVSGTRATVGAQRNALETLYRNVTVMEENTTNAESRIRDSNVAQEMMEYVKTNILLQAANAMLAYAKQRPENILQLLR
ncbi:flagellin N-terminal helical domain-containing protein [Dendrosporobacter sp. 1207_IL3150]|uniref:flagellin N-terminal helical domain-containing protein n=1 Tax=Dendrosporobacter sp. 1207_IL3150 TaxID=3084054 RepID=UPI002FD9D019